MSQPISDKDDDDFFADMRTLGSAANVAADPDLPPAVQEAAADRGNAVIDQAPES